MNPTESLPVPSDGVLLHIGPHKTGTTAIQSAAAASRAHLRELGVLYPGANHNHTAAAIGVMGAPSGWLARQRTTADPARWDALVEEVNRRRGRAFVSSELFCEASPEHARRVIDELGGDCVRVVVTVRSMTRVLSSAWVQALRSGSAETFEEYLRARLIDTPRPRSDAPFETVTPFWRRYDHAALITRWSQVVGAEHVTVVSLEGADHDLLPTAFATLLGLEDPEPLRPREGTRSNRSLTAGEAEALRLVNVALRDTTMTWQEYGTLVRRGAAMRMTDGRTPAPDEPRIDAPSWAREFAGELDGSTADTIEKLGVRALGDLGRLRSAAEHATDGSTGTDQPAVPSAAAAEAVLGALGAALTGNSAFEGRNRRTVPIERRAGARITPRADRAVGTLSTRELLGEVRRRVTRSDRSAKR